MSIQSRARQAARDLAAGKKKPVATGWRPKQTVKFNPLDVTADAERAETERKSQIKNNPHLRNTRRMFGNPMLTQKQRIAGAQLRREARANNARAAKESAK